MKQMTKSKPQILLTNDDGIESPGLWAAAEALSEIGYVWVAAPREQASSTGRSMPLTSDGRITVKQVRVNGQDWTVHAVGGTPAQTVQHGILDVIGQKPDLVVSGINYGLNLGLAVTISGTVGAAIEAAAIGIPSLAVSLETDVAHYYSHSDEVDFGAAAYFTAYFSKRLLNKNLELGSRFLKIEIPANSTLDTPWKMARLSLDRYYIATSNRRKDWDQPHQLGFFPRTDYENFKPGTDTYISMVERKVAVSPLTLDMTAGVSFDQMQEQLSTEV
jgi:5'-nucleotidase